MLNDQIIVETVITAWVVMQSRDFGGVCLVEGGHAAVEGELADFPCDEIMDVCTTLGHGGQCDGREENVVVYHERAVIHLDEQVADVIME